MDLSNDTKLSSVILMQMITHVPGHTHTLTHTAHIHYRPIPLSHTHTIYIYMMYIYDVYVYAVYIYTSHTSHIQIPYTYAHPNQTKKLNKINTPTTTHTKQEGSFEEKLLHALL